MKENKLISVNKCVKLFYTLPKDNPSLRIRAGLFFLQEIMPWETADEILRGLEAYGADSSPFDDAVLIEGYLTQMGDNTPFEPLLQMGFLTDLFKLISEIKLNKKEEL